MFDIFFIFTALLASVAIALILYARKYYGVLEALSIPVIKPTFCMGSDPFGYQKVQHEEDIKRMKQYGPVYGIYEGRFPQIHINDPELIKLIMVKNYDHFKERNIADFGHPVADEGLDWIQGEKWRQIRSLLTTSFTSSRIKQMSEPLRLLVGEHVDELKLKVDDNGAIVKFEFKKWLRTVIVDMVGKCYCGIQFKDNKNPNNEMCQLFCNLLGEDNQHNFFSYTIPMVFPFLRRWFPMMPKEYLDKISVIVTNMLEDRLKNGNTKQADFLGNLLNYWERIETPEFRKLGITKETILAQAMEFFLVSYDSAGTPIVLLIYYLSQASPEIQEKLLEEVDSTFRKYDGVIGHDAVNDMPYLTACLSETYRLIPAFIRAERVCTKEWEHDGLKIPAGMTIIFPLWATNRHPDFHDHPDQFNPERFMPETKGDMNPYAFSTFGHGPKNCAGMKWGYALAKLILVPFLSEFKVVNREDTRVHYKPGNAFIPQFKHIYVDLIKRK